MLKKLRSKYWALRSNYLYKGQSLKAVPINLGVCMTNRCNVRCKYCMREQFKPPKGEITLEQMKSLLKRMPYITGVCIMGLCEPLLNKELPAIIRWLKDEGGYTMSLTTNGMVPLDEDMLDALTRIDDFVFSIDTYDDATHRFLRPGSKLPDIMENFEKLIKFKRERGLGRTDNPPIHINSVITRQNWNQIPGLIKMLEPYAEDLTYLMIDPVTRPDYQTFEDPLMLSKEDFEKDVEKYRRIAKESPLHVIGFDWMFEPSYGYGKCPMAWNSMFIEPNGDVYFCYDYERVLGNVFEEDPLDIWNSDTAKEFRAALLTEAPPLKQCFSCNFARERWQPEGEYLKQVKDGYEIGDVL